METTFWSRVTVANRHDLIAQPWIQVGRSVMHSGGSSPPGDRHACTIRDSLGIRIERLLVSVNVLAQRYAR